MNSFQINKCYFKLLENIFSFLFYLIFFPLSLEFKGPWHWKKGGNTANLLDSAFFLFVYITVALKSCTIYEKHEITLEPDIFL